MFAIYALLSGALWGSSDFAGGRLSKDFRPISVLGATQLISLLFGGILIAVTGQTHLTTTVFWAGLFAGISGYLGLICLYAGLSTGRMGVVSPISSLAAILPMSWALLQGENLTAGKAIGSAIALVGVFLSSGPEFSQGFSLRPLLLAFGAALGFGTAMIFMAVGSKHSPLLTMEVMRLCTAVVTIVITVKNKGFGGLGRRQMPMLAFVGVADFAANLLLGQAVHIGPTAITMILGSTYPVFTVVLAYVLLHERLHKAQYFGALAAVAGVALITAF
jgi:drug/metabolite transporter (DMT)-like permease